MENELLATGVRALLEALARRGGRLPVAFDADGTLWRGDVGEDLLRFLDAERLLARHRGSAFAEYERRLALDPKDAYRFAVAVMEGLKEATLAEACRALFADRLEARLHRFVRPLFESLERAGAEVWIVSGSPFWAVLPGAAALGVEPARVIAARCEVEAGRLTGRISAVPCAEEKVQLLCGQAVRPFLAAGNSPLDVPMLEHAEHGVWVAPAGGEDPHTRAARARGWAVQPS